MYIPGQEGFAEGKITQNEHQYPSTEHQWYQWSEVSAQSPKGTAAPATVWSPCCRLAKDTEVSTTIASDYGADSSLRLWGSWTHLQHYLWIVTSLNWHCQDYFLKLYKASFVAPGDEIPLLSLWVVLPVKSKPIFMSHFAGMRWKYQILNWHLKSGHIGLSWKKVYYSASKQSRSVFSHVIGQHSQVVVVGDPWPTCLRGFPARALLVQNEWVLIRHQHELDDEQII